MDGEKRVGFQIPYNSDSMVRFDDLFYFVLLVVSNIIFFHPPEFHLPLPFLFFIFFLIFGSQKHTAQEVQVTISAEEFGARGKSPYDSYTFSEIPSSSLSHMIRSFSLSLSVLFIYLLLLLLLFLFFFDINMIVV